MKTRFLFTILALACTTANAQSYNCPNEAGGAHLTNAKILIGAPGSPHALHGDVEQVQDGTNIRYHLPDETPRWLVCQYGGKRVEGTAIAGAEVTGGRDVRIPLDPLVSACDLAIRKVGAQGIGESSRAAGLTCERRAPPPPDMM